jgi:hypothetical protein
LESRFYEAAFFVVLKIPTQKHISSNMPKAINAIAPLTVPMK